MAGRSKLSDELIEKAGKLAEEGVPVTFICDSLGITRMSHSNWMRQGEDDFEQDVDSFFARYFYTIKKGQANYVINAGRDIRSGRNGWQGAAWWLERTRQEFMPKQEITAGEDGKVQVILGGKIKDIKKGNLTDSGE